MNKVHARHTRKLRVRARLKRLPTERPRLSVNRSGKHIYAQVIDDAAGRTLAAASTLDAGVKTDHKSGGNVDAAKAVGKLIAQRAVAAGVKLVRFDRGGFIFHGRVRAVAEGAREGGLEF